jgi:phytoene dehydrogenase-like protein
MPISSEYDAIVVGAGPNGLSAAITLARAGSSVLVLEASDTIGGGARSKELTLPGFVHDVCSAIHPLAVVSPAFRQFDLDQTGLSFVHPQLALAHPFDDGTAAVIERSLEKTADRLGADGKEYTKLMRGPAENVDDLLGDLLAPPARLPQHPLLMARFGLHAVRSAQGLVKMFDSPATKGLLAGLAAHSMLPLDKSPSGGVALLLGFLAHAVGWPAARGGSQQIADALVTRLKSLGGKIETNWEVDALDQLPPHDVLLAGVTPRQMTRIAATRFPVRYLRALRRYRYGPGVFKLDLALDGPVPWTAEDCTRAGTVHVGGSIEEITAAEWAANNNQVPEKPFVLVGQQSIFDDSRAPEGKHTLWAYCHVPNGSDADMTNAIENQIERFAPGFRDRILARATRNAVEMESYNGNYVGGDINGGLQNLRQHFARPVLSLNPYATPNPHIYLCSSSTPPGGGVHGMCGYLAARAALRGGLTNSASDD